MRGKSNTNSTPNVQDNPKVKNPMSNNTKVPNSPPPPNSSTPSSRNSQKYLMNSRAIQVTNRPKVPTILAIIQVRNHLNGPYLS